MMPSLGCLWNRPRLERLIDGALDSQKSRAIEAHVAGCRRCGAEVWQLRRLRGLVQASELPVTDPDWSGFWPGVRLRIAQEAPAPVRDAWWLPFWKPVWGHPRVALGGLAVSGLAASLAFWPGLPVSAPQAIAAPVVVQDVSTADPDRSVMVYSSPDDDVTVIWVFNPGEQDEQS